MNTVYLLTSGDLNSDAWDLISIHRTPEGAEKARLAFAREHLRGDASTLTIEPCNLED